MPIFKKQLTPLSKGGQITKHAGKGSQSASMPNRSQINSLASAPGQSINDYSKATPMAQPTAQPGAAGGAPGIGSGNWPGNGM